MINFLFYLSLITLSFGQFAVISKSSGLNIYSFDFIVTFYALYGIFFFLLSKKLVISKNLVLFFLFGFVGVLSLIKPIFILNSSQMLVAALYLLRFIIYLCAAVVSHNLLAHGYLTKNNIYYALIFSGLFISFVGFIQLILLPDFTVLDASLGWDPHKNRLASTFFDPNFTGGYLALLLALILHLIFLNGKFSKNERLWAKAQSLSFHRGELRSHPRAKAQDLSAGNKSQNINFKFLLFSLFIVSLAILLTFSRSAWGMAAIIIFIFGIFKSKYLLLLSLIVVFLAYFAIPRVQTRLSGITDPSDSASFRLVSWQNTLKIVNDNLFLGVGFNAFRYAQIDYGFFDLGTIGGNSGAGSDSSFLLVLATTGLTGFIIFTFAFFFGVFDSWQKNSSRKIFLLSSLLGLFLQAQFINAFFYPQILFLLTLFLVLDS